MLERLVDSVAFGAGSRFASTDEVWMGEDWTTAELCVNTVRAYQTTILDPARRSTPLSDGLVLEVPEGFTGQVTVATYGQALRGAEGDPDLRQPPGLEAMSDVYEPIRRPTPTTRSAGPTGLVLALEVDEVSRQRVSTEQPLRITLPESGDEPVTDLLPVAFDGEDYLPVGYRGDGANVVEVVALPRPAEPIDAQGRPTKRGIGRTVRLFIYKKMGRYTPLTGLKRAELSEDRVVHNEVRADQLRGGQRIALFVHGFNSDTRWMVTSLAAQLQAVQRYDHWLTWDYETFETSVADSGRQLALALRQQAGLGPADGLTVDVYAHSIGCLVTRCMIELSGGHELVDRAVLAGPPNRGTTLASMTRGFLFLLGVAINRASAIPPLGMTGWAFKQLYDQSIGVDDLTLESAIVQQLNGLAEPSNVPYLVLSGENVLEEDGRSRLERLARKMLDRSLDAIFGEQNDIAVGLSSLHGLRHGAYAGLKVVDLPCDHFRHFATAEGLEAIERWLLA